MTDGIPLFPPLDPLGLNYEYLNDLVAQNGITLQWSKSHGCVCIYGGQDPGSPDPQCLTCKGRGVYWDVLSSPFIGLITFIHTSPTPDEPGTIMSEQEGLQITGEPVVTITSDASGIYDEAGIYDLYVQPDVLNRLNVALQVGRQTTLPYPYGATVAPSGAVTIYNTVTKRVDIAASYTVSGDSVVLNGYPPDTSYMVEYMASPSYIAYRAAGAPAHARPFADTPQPKRFRLQALDLWTRAKGSTIAGITAPDIGP